MKKAGISDGRIQTDEELGRLVRSYREGKGLDVIIQPRGTTPPSTLGMPPSKNQPHKS